MSLQSTQLIDEDGQALGRGSGYKSTPLANLSEGDQLSIGQREVEISGIISQADWEQRQVLSKAATAQAQQPRKGGLKRKEREEEEEVEKVAVRSLVLERLKEVNNTKFKPFKMPSRVGGGDSGIVVPRTVAPGTTSSALQTYCMMLYLNVGRILTLAYATNLCEKEILHTCVQLEPWEPKLF